jgi:hypothetical protein
MKRKKPFKRNMILLGVIIAVFVGLVSAIRFHQRENVYFDVDEMNARNAIRKDPTRNGWYDLEAAMALLPDRPDAAVPPESPKSQKEILVEIRDRRVSVHDPIESYSGLTGPDSDSTMLEYIEACRPAFERAALTLEKPTLLCDWPRVVVWGLGGGTRDSVNKELELDRLFEPMAAAIRMDFLHNEDPQRGADLLLLLLRIQQSCQIDLVIYPGKDISHTGNLIDKLIIHADSIEILGLLERVVKLTIDSMVKPELSLARRSNVMDNTIHWAASPESSEHDLDFVDRYIFFQLNRTMRFLKDQMPLFEQLTQIPASEHLDYCANFRNNDTTEAKSKMPNSLVFDHDYFFWDTVLDLGKMDFFQAHFEKQALMFALQRFYIENGKYPDTTDELSPQYLDKIPLNPISDTPFRYQKGNSGYIITGDGFSYTDRHRRTVPAEEIKFIMEDQFDAWPSGEESFSESEESTEQISSVEQE